MSASLDVLLDSVFDYAGLFPPAALSIPEAVAEYSRLLHSPDAVRMRRFVVPVGKLTDFTEALPAVLPAPWPIAVLGSSLDHYRADLDAIEAFEVAGGSRLSVQAYEVKIGDLGLYERALRHLADECFDEVFIELPFDAELPERVVTLAQFEVFGAKARTGGLDPAAFPTATQLAGFIRACVSVDVPFKCTAGLHHPLPTMDPVNQAQHHGFINVIVASALAVTHELSQSEIESVLNESDPSAFWFSEKGAGFRDWELDLDDLQDSRECFISIGSCSLDEPREYLAALPWN